MATAETTSDSRRIVLLGKTGSGKSSLANTIIGDGQVFQVSHSPNSETKICQSTNKSINGKNIQLIDTPGLFDTDPTSTDLSPELIRCITECAPGPHAFLLVLKVEKFTKLEKIVIDIILKYFSEEALKYTTVVFTHGDALPEGMKIKEWFVDNKALTDLVQKCSGRCHVFDSKYWNNSQDKYRNNKVQVEELLKTIDKTVTGNKGGCYTNEFLKKVGDNLQREIEHIRASSSGKISLADIRQKAKEVIYSKLMNNISGALIGVVLGALLGAGGGVMGVIMGVDSADLLKCVAAAVTGAAVGGPTGGIVGSWVSDRWKSPTEAVQDATSFLKEVEPLFQQLNQTYQAGRNVMTLQAN